MLLWLAFSIAVTAAFTAVLWVWYKWQRRHNDGLIAAAIARQDRLELQLLLLDGIELGSIRECFGEPAVILAVKAFMDDAGAGSVPLESIELLLSRGADVNEPGTEWKTALMHAAEGGSHHLCLFLLSHGADAAAHDAFGRTAGDWAEVAGNQRIASLLRRLAAC